MATGDRGPVFHGQVKEQFQLVGFVAEFYRR